MYKIIFGLFVLSLFFVVSSVFASQEQAQDLRDRVNLGLDSVAVLSKSVEDEASNQGLRRWLEVDNNFSHFINARHHWDTLVFHIYAYAELMQKPITEKIARYISDVDTRFDFIATVARSTDKSIKLQYYIDTLESVAYGRR